MKQAKHFRRLWSLMLLLIAMLMPQWAWATDFISEIKVSVHKDKGETARNRLTNDGYTLVNTDLNQGGGGHYVYIGYKTTTNAADAITGLLIVESNTGFDAHSTNYISSAITYNGKNYYRCTNYDAGDARLDCDLNRGRTGTPDIVLYYTKDGRTANGGTPLTSISVVGNTTTTGVTYTRHWQYDTAQNGTSNTDVYGNTNQGGTAHYITYTTHTHDYEATFDWGDNHSSCKATIACSCGDTSSDVACSVTSVLKSNASCTKDGSHTYTATVESHGKTFTDVVNVDDIDALGHSISGGKCSRCSHGFIYYTSTNNAVVTPKRANFGTSVDVVDNTYSNGQGVIETSAPVTQIGDECFYHKDALKSIQIPATVTSIGRYAFTSCTGLTGTLVIPDAVTSIGNDAFELCSTLSGVTFGSSLQSIGEYAFTSCSKLSGTLTLPASLTTIGKSAFKNCSGFTGNLTIPNKVTTIGEDAFDSCSGLTGTLTLPASVTTLQAYSFSKCPFTTVRLEKNSMYAWANYVFDGLSSKGTLLVPSNLVKTYQANKYWLGAFKTITCIAHNIQSVAQKAATCTVDGNTAHYKCSGCDALFTNAAGTATTTLAAVTVKATGHGKTKKYAASYAWEGNASDPTCTFTLKCLDCQADIVKQPLYTTAGTYGSFSATTTPAKCAEKGVVTCQAAGKYTDPNGKNASYTESTTSNATNTTTYAIAAFGHGHKGYTPSYAWIGTADDPTCTFTLFCEECKTNVVNEALTTDAAAANGFYAQTAHVDEGCTDAGYTTYAATGKYPATSPSVAYTEQTPNVKTYGITAHGHGHEGYTPSYLWTGTADDPTCTFTLFCEDCKTNVVNEVLTTDADAANGYYAQSAHLDETCSEDGSTTYTATGKFPAEEPSVAYTEAEPNTNTYAIAAHGHNYADAVWNWADDGHSATCTRTCSVCGDEQHADVTLNDGITPTVTTLATCTTPGNTTYTATVTLLDETYTSTFVVEGDVPRIEHDFTTLLADSRYLAGEPTCSKNATYFKKCSHCDEHNSETWELSDSKLPHTFADNDTRHELCTTCGHTFFHYTSSRANSPVWINSSNKNYDADDNVLKVVSNTCDADRHGVIEFDGTLVRIGQYGFSGSLFAGTLVIPSTVTTIDQFAFTGDDSFTSVEFGPNLTTIGQFAFSGCSGLTGTIVIPDAVTSVGLSAFYNCNISNLVARCQLDLRSCGVYEYQITRTHEFTEESRTHQAQAATCQKDATYYITCANCHKPGTETWTDEDSKSAHTFADDDTRHELCTACGHTFFHYTFEPGMPPMIMPGPSARFLDPKGNSLEIVSFSNPDDIDSGESYMEFDGELATIGESAFLHSMFEGSYIIPFTVTTIGDAAFANNRNVKGIELGASVTTIGIGAFADCSSITGPLTIPASVTEMGYNAFSGCRNVETFVVPCTSPLTTEDLRNAIIPDEKLEIRHADDSEKTLVSAATCRNDAVYHLVCSACGIDDNITEPHTATGLHTFADDDINHELCTTCGMSFAHTIFYYTVEPGAAPVNPYWPDNLLDAAGNPLAIVSNTVDEEGNGVMEFDGTLVTIGRRAFLSAPFIGSLTIPASVTTIGEHAFGVCDHLTGLELGASVTTIGNYAFSNCTSLTGTLTIPDAVTTIGDGAFAYCDLTGLELGASVTTIGDYAFSDCTSLTGTLTIPDAVTTIGNNAFSDCTSLTDLELGASVTTIGNYAFSDCYALTDLELGASVTTIGNYAFNRCYGLTGTLTIPDAVTEIGEGAFSYCDHLTGLKLGAAVTTIGEYAFFNCQYLAGDVKLPATVTTIGRNAFRYCDSVKSFYVLCTSPLTQDDLDNAGIKEEKVAHYHADESNMTLVQASTCTKDAIYHIVCGACGVEEDAPVLGTATGHTFDDDDINHELCTTCGMSFAHTIFYYTVEPGADPVNPYMPKNLLDAVGNPLTIVSNTVDEEGNGVMEFDGTLVTIGESAFSGAPFIGSLTIPASVTTIGKYAFEACNHLTGLELGASVTTIGALAFERCSGLTGTLTIPASVTTIGELAFAYCDHLTGLELGASVTTIGEYAFNRCNGLTGTLTIPDAVTTIGVGAFAYCDNLTGLELGASVTTIGNYAFNCCNGLTGLKLGAAVTTIGEYAFSDCTSLTGTLTIPDAVTTIGNYAFSNCYALTDLKLGASVTTIGRYAFSDCYALTDLELGASVTTIGEYAFSDCTSLTGTLTIPDAVTTIGDAAFFNCCGLTGLKLGAAVTTIGEYAFYECEYLAGIVKLPATVTEIGESAFSDCNRVKSFYVLCTSPLTQDDLYYAGIEEKKVAHYHADESNMTLVQAATCATDAIYHIECDACGVEEETPVLGTATGLHTFADDDINHELCTTCGMSFVHTIFYYTVEPGADPVDLYSPENLLDAVGNPLAIVSNTVDEEGNGVMEFDGTLVTIGKYAFSGAPFIGSLTIPSTVTTIGEDAFYGCSGLTGLELGASVTTIGEYAFESCSGLTGTLTIPASVTTVGYGAFFDTDFENCLTPCTLDLEYSGLNPEIITYLHHYDEHSYCSICGQFDMPSEPSIGDLVRFINFLQQPEAETSGYSTSYVKDIAARILGHETAVWNPEKMLKTNIKNRTGAVNIETNVKQLPTAESQDVQMLDDEGLLWAVLDNNADLHIVTSMPKIKMKSCHGLFSNISTTDYIYGLEHLDLVDVTDMSDMFAGCNALQEVNLYDLYAPNVTNTSRMFYGCERIEYIDLKGCLTMTEVTEKADMFTGCGTKATDSDGDPYVTVVNVEESPEEITATTEGTGWDDNYMLIYNPE